MPLLEKVTDPLQRLPVIALALHQLGKNEAAQDALREADIFADRRLRDTLAKEIPTLPNALWEDWLTFRIIRREAHQNIHGQPLPDSPYERLFQARVLPGSLARPTKPKPS